MYPDTRFVAPKGGRRQARRCRAEWTVEELAKRWHLPHCQSEIYLALAVDASIVSTRKEKMIPRHISRNSRRKSTNLLASNSSVFHVDKLETRYAPTIMATDCRNGLRTDLRFKKIPAPLFKDTLRPKCLSENKPTSTNYNLIAKH